MLGKFPGSWISGFVASRVGYAAVFGAGAAVTIAFLFVIKVLVARRATAERAPA